MHTHTLTTIILVEVEPIRNFIRIVLTSFIAMARVTAVPIFVFEKSVML